MTQNQAPRSSPLIPVAVASILTWSAWATVAILDRPTRSEIPQIVDETAPYVEDRKLIFEQLTNARSDSEQFRNVLKDFRVSLDGITQAIVELRTLLKLKGEHVR